VLRGKTGATVTLNLNEAYETIQGEGLLAGTPSFLIRLQGCNLRCPWCDQPSALDSEGGKRISLSRLLQLARRSPFRHALITGGEPLLHSQLPDLIEALLEEGFSVQIETNGTLWNPALERFGDKIHITCSPKGVAGYRVHPRVLSTAAELKFVVDIKLGMEVLLREDFLPFIRKGKVILQPESNREDMFQKALHLQRELARAGFTVRIIPQIHKILGIR